MATFPRSENDILELASKMIAGLTDNTATYPSPPVLPADLQAVLTSALTLNAQTQAAKAAYEQVQVTRLAGFEELEEAMKANLRYAETTVDFDNALLALLGWAGRKTPSAAEAPGQPLELSAPEEGDGTIKLIWKKPETGGPVASYKIERRERPTGAWFVVEMSYETEKLLTSQERGKEWEYRVKATSPAGESTPSNSVAAVL